MSIANSIANKRPVQGVGINDADYLVRQTINGKTILCPFYRCWANMLCRCYSAKSLSDRPTYLGCKVCDEWLNSFIAFKSWMELQDWKGKELDKDLIGDGKLYSPENCVFVSRELNTLFLDHGAARGEYPIGVYWSKQKGKYKAQINANGKHKFLGYFTSPTSAHEAWLAAKLEIANSFLSTESNPRIRYAIECGIEKLQETVEADNED